MSWQIYIKDFISGASYTLDVNKSDTILCVKTKLKLQQYIAVEEQQFIFGYLEFGFLKTDSLSNYNLQEPQSLMMTAILKDGTSLYVHSVTSSLSSLYHYNMLIGTMC